MFGAFGLSDFRASGLPGFPGFLRKSRNQAIHEPHVETLQFICTPLPKNDIGSRGQNIMFRPFGLSDFRASGLPGFPGFPVSFLKHNTVIHEPLVEHARAGASLPSPTYSG
jgi:hypothetical protein